MTMEPLQSEAPASKPSLSKRQRRALGSNPSTTWQQQPRIKSAGARAKAYLACANLADEKDDANKKQKKHASAGGKGGARQTAADLLDPQLDLHSPEVKFGRLLGGTDQRSRHAAVKMLREYLRARSDIANGRGLSELDLLKLWKGLWYTLYMADKVPVQDKLSQILAELMWCLAGTEEEDEYAGQEYMQFMDEEEEEGDDAEEGFGDVLGVNVFDDDGSGDEEVDEDGDTMKIVEIVENSDEDEEEGSGQEDGEDEEEEEEEDHEEQRIRDMNETHCRGAHLVSLFVSTFLTTVRREWGNVDKHRVDKFYTAVRLMVGEAYKYMAKRHWNLGIIRLFNDVLYSEGLAADTPGLTNGLRYHLIDICVGELAKANRDAAMPLTEATFLDCLEPFFGLARAAVDKNVQRRVMENVLLKFLNEYSFVCPAALAEDEEGEMEEERALIFADVHVGTVGKFLFDMASDSDTDERFRKSLYDMHKAYVRQVRAAGRDVDLDGHLQEDGMSDDEEEEEEGDGQDAGEASSESADVLPTISEKEPDVEQEEDVTSAVEKFEPEKKKKKRKKRKSKGNKEADEEVEAPETPKAAEATTPKTKSSKKKRKKQEAESAEQESANSDDMETPKPKSKKKKQKSPPSVDPRAMHSPDQIVGSPTQSDDEAAAAAVEASASKRVSFGKMNHCKSYKASTKALKTLDQERWDTRVRTPDKSILREKKRAAEAAAETSEKKKKASGRKRRAKKGQS